MPELPGRSSTASSLPLGADSHTHAMYRATSIRVATPRPGMSRNYASFVVAAQDRDRFGGRTGSPIAPSIVSELSATQKRALRRYTRLWWTSLVLAQTLFASTIIALVKVGSAAVARHNYVGYLLWLLLSSGALAAASVGVWTIYTHREARAKTEREWVKMEAEKWKRAVREKGKEAQKAAAVAERLRSNLRSVSRERRRSMSRGRFGSHEEVRNLETDTTALNPPQSHLLYNAVTATLRKATNTETHLTDSMMMPSPSMRAVTIPNHDDLVDSRGFSVGQREPSKMNADNDNKESRTGKAFILRQGENGASLEDDNFKPEWDRDLGYVPATASVSENRPVQNTKSAHRQDSWTLDRAYKVSVHSPGGGPLKDIQVPPAELPTEFHDFAGRLSHISRVLPWNSSPGCAASKVPPPPPTAIWNAPLYGSPSVPFLQPPARAILNKALPSPPMQALKPYRPRNAAPTRQGVLSSQSYSADKDSGARLERHECTHGDGQALLQSPSLPPPPPPSLGQDLPTRSRPSTGYSHFLELEDEDSAFSVDYDSRRTTHLYDDIHEALAALSRIESGDVGPNAEPEHVVRGGHGELGSMQSDDNIGVNAALEEDVQSLDEGAITERRARSLRKVGSWVDGVDEGGRNYSGMAGGLMAEGARIIRRPLRQPRQRE